MHVGGTVHVAGCPADVSHGAVPRNRGRGDRHRRFGWSPGRSEDALAATAGTNDSPWRDKRANDPDPRRLTQIRWDRTPAGMRPSLSWRCPPTGTLSPPYCPPQPVRIFRILPLTWSPLTESNRRPSPYHGDALPTELRGRVLSCLTWASGRPALHSGRARRSTVSSAPGVREPTLLPESWRLPPQASNLVAPPRPNRADRTPADEVGVVLARLADSRSGGGIALRVSPPSPKGLAPSLGLPGFTRTGFAVERSAVLTALSDNRYLFR